MPGVVYATPSYPHNPFWTPWNELYLHPPFSLFPKAWPLGLASPHFILPQHDGGWHHMTHLSLHNLGSFLDLPLLILSMFLFISADSYALIISMILFTPYFMIRAICNYIVMLHIGSTSLITTICLLLWYNIVMISSPFLSFSYGLIVSPSTNGHNITWSPMWLLMTCLIFDSLWLGYYSTSRQLSLGAVPCVPIYPYIDTLILILLA